MSQYKKMTACTTPDGKPGVINAQGVCVAVGPGPNWKVIVPVIVAILVAAALFGVYIVKVHVRK